MSEVEVIFKQAMQYWNEGSLPMARMLFSQYINLGGDNPTELYWVAKFKQEEGQFNEATNLLETACAKDPYNLNLIKEFASSVVKDADTAKLYKGLELSKQYLKYGEDLELRYHLTRLLFTIGRQEESLFEVMRIKKMLEQDLKQRIDLKFKTLVLEASINISLKNYNNARLVIKQIFNLDQTNKLETDSVTELFRACMAVDLFHLFISNSKWASTVKDLNRVYQTVFAFYTKYEKGCLNDDDINLLASLNLEPLLTSKLYSLAAYYLKAKKDNRWVDLLLKSRDINKDDLLGQMLYSDLMIDSGDHKEAWQVLFDAVKLHTESKGLIKMLHSMYKGLPSEEELKLFSGQSLTKIKVKESVKFISLGGGDCIGGSSYLLEISGRKFLFDAGIKLNSNDSLPEYSTIDLNELEAVFITHAHMDHVGSLPFIYSQAPQVPIYCTEPTKDLARILITDYIKNNGDNFKYFDLATAEQCLFDLNTVSYGQPVKLPKGFRAVLYPAGHILGAASVYLQSANTNVLVTGDFSLQKQKTVTGAQIPEGLPVDVLIMESTYGYSSGLGFYANRLHQEQLLVVQILDVINKGGTILIPAFAVGRAQEVLLILKDYFQKEKYLPFDVYIDGRVVDVCEEYDKYALQGKYVSEELKDTSSSLFYGHGIKSASEERRRLNKGFEDFILEQVIPRSCCIVTSSGMLMDGSASSRYASFLVEGKQNSIAITGYQDEESPGAVLKDWNGLGEQTVVFGGKHLTRRCSVQSYHLSAHASREELFQFVLKLAPKNVILVHGDMKKNGQAASIFSLISQISGTSVYEGRNLKEINL